MVKEIEDAGSLVGQTQQLLNSELTFEETCERIYQTLHNGKSDQKAEFALDVIYEIDPDMLSVPAYIDQGLTWLQDYLCPEE